MARQGRLVLLAGVLLLLCGGTALGAKRAAIPDDLRDVVDDEEDEEWRHWGAGSGARDVPERPPPDLSRMDPAALRAEILRGHGGPSLGFVKLRPGVRRSREEVAGVATRWSNVLRTGSVAAKFVAVDFGTLMFTMERGRDMRELKEFILGQAEAYEFKVGDQIFRRPGDPPLDQVIDMLRKQKKKEDEL
ncbi:hypothetical protein D1007_45110 [Hordeum vulgare]|uniref:Mesoderm development candidate 2 n=1 Tax=Hordeum vulgare subsp. vulgare TaxID=112509 RepID=A0A8I6XKT7_HORVV|nr:uncharacterized protein LOC123449716 [Hordeum vulgare subsp. vulgare]KAE8781589.1 hypothetical protein D1007_45110 [Hordeum vulgare]